mmetsp:Transcript_24382/g.37785  ORF Transcript_24382/g.37785 Transcript_24382/m.37785 type:complete len:198 (-) Transcript_24382:55-648(-)
MGLTSIMLASEAPPDIKDPTTIAKLLSEALALLKRVQIREEKQAAKKAERQIDPDSDDDDDYDEEDFTSSDEEEEKVAGDMADDKDGLGFTNENAEDDEEDEEEYYDLKFEIRITLDQIKSPILKQDEFQFFAESIKALQQSRADVQDIFFRMEATDIDALKKLMRTQRIDLKQTGEGPQEARRIVKAKRRRAPGGQ